MDRVKKIAFLVSKPGLGNEGFLHHWREVHGPLVAGTPGYADWRLRYVQNHILGPAPLGKVFSFAGMAEFWLPGPSPNEDAFSATAIYQDRIASDERNFIDMERTISFAATEQVLIPGKGLIKVVVVSRKPDGSDHGQAREQLISAARPLAEMGLVGWRVDHVIAGTFRLPGAAHADPLQVDCMESLWFENDSASKDYFAKAKKLRGQLFDPRDQIAFRAREYVFHDILNDP